MLLLGIDLGTSSVKVSVVDADTRQCLSSASYPAKEAVIQAPHPGWAEQSPDTWWHHTQQAILLCHSKGSYSPDDIVALGISYQMHGLVLVDRNQRVLRPAIIWCDSRAVTYGQAASEKLGKAICQQHLLNAPGNFTASKLAWVKENEPEVYAQVYRFMLPGDFIAMKLTGEITTTPSALSEGVFWDFQHNRLSDDVMDAFGFDKALVPAIQPVFSNHGGVQASVAADLKLRAGIPVGYKAGDQLNNAFALNVMQPGEIAATAGTSGVVYAVAGETSGDAQSRVNSFAHVNHRATHPRIGHLLCINGAGIFYRWIRDNFGGGADYQALNKKAATVAPGAEGLIMLPFGNGAERMLDNQLTGAHLCNIDFNMHHSGHLVRAAQEAVAFAFRYGIDIMKEAGLLPDRCVVRAGRANMFLSPVFTEAFVNVTGFEVELFDTEGSIGAALAAGLGAEVYTSETEVFSGLKPLHKISPDTSIQYEPIFERWKQRLHQQLQHDSNNLIQPAT